MTRKILASLSDRAVEWLVAADAARCVVRMPAQLPRRARLALMNLEDRTVPATLTVTSLADNGAGTLREAITLANADTLDDTVTVTATGSIDLLSALPIITGNGIGSGNLTLTGPGSSKLTVRRSPNAAGSFGLIAINDAADFMTVGITGMTFSGATSGHAVNINSENATLTDVVVRDNLSLDVNPGSAVRTTGAALLTMIDCLVTGNSSNGNGGGIYLGSTGSTLNLINTTVSGNTCAGVGGGIRIGTGGNVNMTDSTIANNVAIGDGGGVYFLNGGSLIAERCTISGNASTEQTGGLYFFGPISGAGYKLTNCTITGNVSRRGGAGVGFFNHTGGPAQILNSTITGNTSNEFAATGGGGVAIMSGTGPVQIDSSIVSGNLAPNLPASQKDLRQNTGAITADFSAIGVDPGFALGGASNLPFGSVLDLGPLTPNAPGKTATMALGAASAALDKGSTAVSGTAQDQNGTTRPDGAAPDIGAFERIQADPEATATTLTTISTPTPGPDYTFTVVYDNNADPIDTSSLGNNDIHITRITGAAGFTPLSVDATLVSFTPASGKPITATYKFSVPGGSWDSADNGLYRFTVNAGSVLSTPGGKAAPNVGIGDLTVGISQTFTVTNLLDSGPGSLREAMNNVNVVTSNDTIVFDPTLFSGGSKILNLATALPAISDSVSMTGPGSTLLTVQRQLGSVLNFGIFTFLNPVTTLNVGVSGMTISRGSTTNDGGGINAANESITLNDVVLSGNSARLGGGLFTSVGAITANNSTFSGNTAAQTGGAIFSGNSALLLTNSTVSGNLGQIAGRGGGGIILFGNLPAAGATILNCTISGNTTNGRGGGINIFYAGGTININNSTITGNSANATTAEYGGGFTGGGLCVELSSNLPLTVNINSSIISGNTVNPGAPAASADLAVGAVFSPITMNVSKSAIGVNPGVALNSPNGPNIPFGSVLNLGPLTGNGGPTKTHALGLGSAAIDTGVVIGTLTTDQRGLPRNKFGGVDIGSFEFQGDVPTVTGGPYANVTVDNPTTNPYVFTATFASNPSQINVSTLDGNDIRITGPNGFNQLATFVSSVPPTNGSPVIATYKFTPPGGTWDGNDNGTYTISVEGVQVFNTAGNSVPAGSLGTFTVTLPITRIVTNNNDSGPGSLRQAILDTNANPAADFITFDTTGGFFDGTPAKSLIPTTLGTLQIIDPVTITGPGSGKATISGGGLQRVFAIAGDGQIAVSISKLTITNGAISDGGDGAAIGIADELVTLTDMVISNNSSNGGGGGILINAGGTLTVNNSTISNNTASGDDGGAIIAGGGARVVLSNSTVSGNSANDDGGGLYFINGGSLLVDRSTISGNVSSGAVDGKGGGALYFFGAVDANDLIFTNSTISGNTSTIGFGGGLSFIDTVTVAGANEIIIRNTTITENSSGSGGGGIAITGTSPADIALTSSVLSGNLTVGGGAPSDLFNIGTGLVTGTFSGVGEDPTFGYTNDPSNLPFLAALNLGALQLNLGGTTKTHLPGTGSPLLNAGSNPAGLLVDQNGNSRSFGQTDIGSVEVQPVGPPAVSSFTVNNGANQRSRITTITVTFAGPVTVGQFTALGAITLTRTLATSVGTVGTVVQTGATGANGLITVTQPGPANQLVLTFSNANAANESAGVEYGSLADGRWQLAVTPSGFTSTLNDVTLRRLFGDFESGPGSNGTVDAGDFANFGGSFGTTGAPGFSPFDYDNNGTIDSGDLGAIGARFGFSV